MNAQRKTLILIIALFILVVGGLFFVYQSFIAGDKTGDSGETTTGTGGRDTLFPSSEGLGRGESAETQTTGPVPTLRQISNVPTAGGIIFNTEENTVIRYIERSTGHIFETTINSLEQNRISNTTIPRIQESTWSPDGEMVILRYLDENEVLKSFYGKVLKDVGALEGWFLSNNITDIAVHEDGDIFYIRRVGNDAEGFISNFDGTNSRTVFSSKIYDWTALWIENSIGVATKSSRGVNGFLYQLQSGVRTKLLSANGLLTKINTDGTKILFSTSNTNGTRLWIYDRDSKGTTRVPFTTLAEKCVWGTNFTLFCASPYSTVDGIVPDDWYKGVFSFSDDIWFYNTETETAQLIYDANANGKVFDAINLVIDSEQKMLLFTNKDDLTLWGLSL